MNLVNKIKGFIQSTFGTHVKFDYYVLIGDRAPESIELCHVSNLWLDLGERRWKCFVTGRWRDIPDVKYQHRGFHNYIPALRLTGDPGDVTRSPKWDYHDSVIRHRLVSASATCKENAWILNVLELWYLQEVDHYRVDLVLEALLKFPTAIPQAHFYHSPEVFTAEVLPSLDRAKVTLRAWTSLYFTHLADGNVHDSTFFSDEINVPEFETHFTNYLKSDRALTCLGVPASNQKLRFPHSLAEVGVELPETLRQEGSLHYDPSRSGHYEFDASFGLPGAYSSQHQDCYISPMIEFHGFGSKLWLFWPLNSHNFRYMRHAFLSGFGSIMSGCILSALHHLTGLSYVFVQNPSTTFVVPPCTLHAVITIERSCHLSAVFSHFDYFDSAITLLDLWTKEWKKETAIDSNELPTLTKTEVDHSEAPSEIFDAILAWARFLQGRRHTLPEPFDHCTRFSESVRRWALGLVGSKSFDSIDKDSRDLLGRISNDDWDF